MENENKTPGDAGFTPDTDSKSDSQNNNGSTEGQSQKTVSPRKLLANRENAKKSTGPKTPRGKRNSSFNSLKHGLQAKKVMFAPDGKLLDEGLQRLFETLHDRYSTGEVADELLIELAIVDYWHLQKGLEHELKQMAPTGVQFHPKGAMPTLVRYMTANRRAFDKSLQMLRQLPANNTDDDAKVKTVDRESESTENDSWAATHGGGTPSNLVGQALPKSTEAGAVGEGAEIEENGTTKFPPTPVDQKVGGEEEGEASV